MIIRITVKRNGCSVECITLWTLISPPKCGLQHLRRLIYGLLTMAKPAESLVGVKDTGKVRNWRVPNLRIVLLFLWYFCPLKYCTLGTPRVAMFTLWKGVRMPTSCSPVDTQGGQSNRCIPLHDTYTTCSFTSDWLIIQRKINKASNICG